MSLVRIAAFAALLLWVGVATAASLIVAGRVGVPPTFPLMVANGVLKTQSGTPYLIFGDSPQGANSLPLCSAGNTYALCSGSTDALPANATFVAYIKDRQVQGFNSIWINILCEQYTSCNNNGSTQEGTFPFTAQLSGTGYPGGSNYTTDTCPENGNINATPNDMDCWDMSSGINVNGTATGANAAYWAHIDGYFKIAAQLGMQVFAGPLSADACNNRSTTAQSNGAGSIAWMYANNSTLKPANINLFADFLYARYGNPASANYAPNLVWWIGNDYNCWDSVNRAAHFLPGIDNVVFSFASRLHTDEAGSTHPHIMVSAIDGFATSFTDTVNSWQNILSLNGAYYVGAMYDGALLAHAQNSTTIPPMVVEDQYAGEDFDGIDDGTAPPTAAKITGCDQQSLGGTNALQGDPNTCPFRERAQFWQFVLAGGYAGYLGGNHYTWTFNQGWNNGSVQAGSNTCTGTSGAGHSPCLDVTSNVNLTNAVAFLKKNIAWYKLIPDVTRVPDVNGYGTGTWAASPLVLAAGCYPTNSCAQYYIGQSYASVNTLGQHRGTLQNIMPVSGVTSDGLAGIVYINGINSACTFYSNGDVTNCIKAGGQQFTVNNAKITGASGVTAAWYDPSGPMTSPTSIVCSPSGTPCSGTTQVYTTPAANSHADTATSDWVLLLTSSGSVGPAPTAFLSAANLATPTLNSGASTTIPNGGSATLTWDSANAASCTSTDFTTGSSPGIGTVTVSPTTTKTYHLTCGTASTTALVTVSGTRRDAAAGVGTSGCTGAGTTASPWNYLCIQNAVNAASAGDTIFLRAGQWSLNTGDATFVAIDKQVNLVGAGSGNTFDVWGHVNNASGADLCPTTPASGITCVSMTGTSYTQGTAPQRAGFIQFGSSTEPDTNCANLEIAHIFFDGSLTTDGGDGNGLVFLWNCPGPLTINDIRHLGYAGNNPETQFFLQSDNFVTIKNSVFAAAASGIPASGGYPGNQILETNGGNGMGNNYLVQNNVFYEMDLNPVFLSQITYAGNTLYFYNDGTADTVVDPGFGWAGAQLGNLAVNSCGESGKPSGQCNGDYHLFNTNNLFYGPGHIYPIGSGINDASTSGGLNDLNYTGNWVIAGTPALDTCQWHLFNDQGNCTFGADAQITASITGSSGTGATLNVSTVSSGTINPNANPDVSDIVNGTGVVFGSVITAQTGGTAGQAGTYTLLCDGLSACANVGSGAMTVYSPGVIGMALNVNVDTSCNESNNGTGFNITNNSLIGTTGAIINALGGKNVDNIHCTLDSGSGIIKVPVRAYGFTALNNYLSSPSNQYFTNANAFSPNLGSGATANFCASGGAGTVPNCATSGFTTLPTASFTIGTLYADPVRGNVVPISSPSFTAQYGAVQWLASTTSTPPLANDARWSSNNTHFPCTSACAGVANANNSYVPPVSLSGVTHGSTVYLWVMDSAGNIGAATPVALP